MNNLVYFKVFLYFTIFLLSTQFKDFAFFDCLKACFCCDCCDRFLRGENWEENNEEEIENGEENKTLHKEVRFYNDEKIENDFKDISKYFVLFDEEIINLENKCDKFYILFIDLSTMTRKKVNESSLVLKKLFFDFCLKGKIDSEKEIVIFDFDNISNSLKSIDDNYKYNVSGNKKRKGEFVCYIFQHFLHQKTKLSLYMDDTDVKCKSKYNNSFVYFYSDGCLSYIDTYFSAFINKIFALNKVGFSYDFIGYINHKNIYDEYKKECNYNYDFCKLIDLLKKKYKNEPDYSKLLKIAIDERIIIE